MMRLYKTIGIDALNRIHHYYMVNSITSNSAIQKSRQVISVLFLAASIIRYDDDWCFGSNL